LIPLVKQETLPQINSHQALKILRMKIKLSKHLLREHQVFAEVLVQVSCVVVDFNHIIKESRFMQGFKLNQIPRITLGSQIFSGYPLCPQGTILLPNHKWDKHYYLPLFIYKYGNFGN
jgi:hypothetical protein